MEVITQKLELVQAQIHNLAVGIVGKDASAAVEAVILGLVFGSSVVFGMIVFNFVKSRFFGISDLDLLLAGEDGKIAAKKKMAGQPPKKMPKKPTSAQKIAAEKKRPTTKESDDLNRPDAKVDKNQAANEVVAYDAKTNLPLPTATVTEEDDGDWGVVTKTGRKMSKELKEADLPSVRGEKAIIKDSKSKKDKKGTVEDRKAAEKKKVEEKKPVEKVNKTVVEKKPAVEETKETQPVVEKQSQKKNEKSDKKDATVVKEDNIVVEKVVEERPVQEKSQKENVKETKETLMQQAVRETVVESKVKGTSSKVVVKADEDGFLPILSKGERWCDADVDADDLVMETEADREAALAAERAQKEIERRKREQMAYEAEKKKRASLEEAEKARKERGKSKSKKGKSKATAEDQKEESQQQTVGFEGKGEKGEEKRAEKAKKLAEECTKLEKKVATLEKKIEELRAEEDNQEEVKTLTKQLEETDASLKKISILHQMQDRLDSMEATYQENSRKGAKGKGEDGKRKKGFTTNKDGKGFKDGKCYNEEFKKGEFFAELNKKKKEERASSKKVYSLEDDEAFPDMPGEGSKKTSADDGNYSKSAALNLASSGNDSWASKLKKTREVVEQEKKKQQLAEQELKKRNMENELKGGNKKFEKLVDNYMKFDLSVSKRSWQKELQSRTGTIINGRKDSYGNSHGTNSYGKNKDCSVAKSKRAASQSPKSNKARNFVYDSSRLMVLEGPHVEEGSTTGGLTSNSGKRDYFNMKGYGKAAYNMKGKGHYYNWNGYYENWNNGTWKTENWKRNCKKNEPDSSKENEDLLTTPNKKEGEEEDSRTVVLTSTGTPGLETVTGKKPVPTHEKDYKEFLFTHEKGYGKGYGKGIWSSGKSGKSYRWTGGRWQPRWDKVSNCGMNMFENDLFDFKETAYIARILKGQGKKGKGSIHQNHLQNENEDNDQNHNGDQNQNGNNENVNKNNENGNNGNIENGKNNENDNKNGENGNSFADTDSSLDMENLALSIGHTNVLMNAFPLLFPQANRTVTQVSDFPFADECSQQYANGFVKQVSPNTHKTQVPIEKTSWDVCWE